jgi:glucan phosphoethanolaminetransferase (alkaline phosphatase superfamily)
MTIVGLAIALLFSIVTMVRRIKQKNPFPIKILFKNSIILLVILFGICFMSRTGYDNSERNFNERVVGYYTSYLDNYSLYHPGEGLYDQKEPEKEQKIGTYLSHNKGRSATD